MCKLMVLIFILGVLFPKRPLVEEHMVCSLYGALIYADQMATIYASQTSRNEDEYTEGYWQYHREFYTRHWETCVVMELPI